LETESLIIAGSINFQPITLEVILGLIILSIMLFLSALISGSEVAFFSLSPTDRLFIGNSKKKAHKFIRDFQLIPDKLLAAILVSNHFINVGIVILSTYLINKTVDFSEAEATGIIIQVVAITFILLLFSEILPKIFAANYSLGFISFMALPLKVCIILFTPLIYILIHSTSFINNRLAKYNKNLSLDDITHALELTSEEDLSDDKEILEGIVKFGSTCVYEIMTPRIDVVAIEMSTTTDKIINTINYSGYSRIPVYLGTFDKIEGILYIKDLLSHLEELESFNWPSIIRPPYYVPENKKIDDLLKEFQKNKVHMAIVVDEYGGTSGIVTLEDILEEIVGDISDEFDDEDILYSKINDKTYLFDGKTTLKDFCKICSLDEDLFSTIRGDADSLAGLLLEMKKNFPKQYEKLSFQQIDFIVEAVDNRRIKKIKVVFN
jgi:putative hemolysin